MRTDSELSTSALIGLAFSQVRGLFRRELVLARREAGDAIGHAVIALACFAFAGIVLLPILILVADAARLALIRSGYDPVYAPLMVAGIYGAIALGLVLRALRAIRDARHSSARPFNRLREDADKLKESL